MDSFESDRIARGRAKVINGNYDRWDSDVRSYLDYEQKQINRQENFDRESQKRAEENRQTASEQARLQERLDRQNEQDYYDRKLKAYQDRLDREFKDAMRQAEIDRKTFEYEIEKATRTAERKKLELQCKEIRREERQIKLKNKIKIYRYIFCYDELIIRLSNAGHPISEKRLTEYHAKTSNPQSENFALGSVFDSFPERFRDRFRTAAELVDTQMEHLKTEPSICVLQDLLDIEIEKFKQRVLPENSKSIPIKKWYLEEYLSV
jgi:hypothetical protein